MCIHSRKASCLHACVMSMSYHDSKLWSWLWLHCEPMHTRSSIGYMCNVNELVVTIRTNVANAAVIAVAMSLQISLKPL